MDHINDERPTSSVITGDFNGKCSKCCNKDIINSGGHCIVKLVIFFASEKLILSHHQLDLNQLSTDVPIL